MTKNEYIASIMLEAADLLKEDNEQESLNEGIGKTISNTVGVIIEKIVHICRQIKAWLQTITKGDIVIDEDCETINVDRVLDIINKIPNNINDPEDILTDILLYETSKKYKKGDKISRNKIISIVNRCEVITRKISNIDNDKDYNEILKFIYYVNSSIIALQSKALNNDTDKNTQSKISKEFRIAVERHDRFKIRHILKNSLLIDKSFKLFDDYMDFASKKISNLYDDHDGTKLNMNKNEWTRSYMDTLMRELNINFSKERINHLKKVITYVYSNK